MLSRFGLFLIIAGLLLAAILSTLLQIINFEEESLLQASPTSPALGQNGQDLLISDKLEHTFVFMQVCKVPKF